MFLAINHRHHTLVSGRRTIFKVISIQICKKIFAQSQALFRPLEIPKLPNHWLFKIKRSKSFLGCPTFPESILQTLITISDKKLAILANHRYVYIQFNAV